jgi:hypothetical protein
VNKMRWATADTVQYFPFIMNLPGTAKERVNIFRNWCTPWPQEKLVASVIFLCKNLQN